MCYDNREVLDCPAFLLQQCAAVLLMRDPSCRRQQCRRRRPPAMPPSLLPSPLIASGRCPPLADRISRCTGRCCCCAEPFACTRGWAWLDGPHMRQGRSPLAPVHCCTSQPPPIAPQTHDQYQTTCQEPTSNPPRAAQALQAPLPALHARLEPLGVLSPLNWQCRCLVRAGGASSRSAQGASGSITLQGAARKQPATLMGWCRG